MNIFCINFSTLYKQNKVFYLFFKEFQFKYFYTKSNVTFFFLNFDFLGLDFDLRRVVLSMLMLMF